jgi:hypothetical protein
MAFLFLSGHGDIIINENMIDLQQQPNGTEYSVFFPVELNKVFYMGHGNSLVLMGILSGAKTLKDMLELNPATRKIRKQSASKQINQYSLWGRDVPATFEHRLYKCLPKDYPNLLFLHTLDPTTTPFKGYALQTKIAEAIAMVNMQIVLNPKPLEDICSKINNWNDFEIKQLELTEESVVQAFLNPLDKDAHLNLPLSVFLNYISKLKIACHYRPQFSNKFSIKGVYLQCSQMTSESAKKKHNPPKGIYYHEFSLPKNTTMFWDACRSNGQF